MVLIAVTARPTELRFEVPVAVVSFGMPLAVFAGLRERRAGVTKAQRYSSQPRYTSTGHGNHPDEPTRSGRHLSASN
jgi:hypothetical protein